MARKPAQIGRVKLKLSDSAVRARYDAAQTHAGNEKTWAFADALSAAAANSPEVRRTLRNRSRYERANNCYLRGMIETLANDTVGTGPRLQLRTGNAEADRFVEREFAKWAKAVKLAQKLRTMKIAQVGDGEVFGLFRTNDALRHAVKLDLTPIEADQITAAAVAFDRLGSDGISFDAFGNPTSYTLQATHPGDLITNSLDPRQIAADQMIHWFKADRPGQLRGIPQITPALVLCPMLRRFTLAVLDAAEIAASISGIVQSDAPPDEGGYDVDPLDTFDYSRGMLTTLPAGWKLSQMEAEQPTTTYPAFKRELISETARCLHMPYGLAAGDHSPYNYASGRLDHQLYIRSILVDQADIGCTYLDHIFGKWLEEAALIEGYLPQEMRRQDIRDDLPEHDWFWDGFQHIDPKAEADADDTRLGNGTLSYPEYFSRRGLDYEAEMDRQADALKVPRDEYRRRLADKLLAPKAAPAPTNDNAEREETANAA